MNIQWDNRITMGNLLTMGGMIFAMITGYITLVNRVSSSEALLNKLDAADKQQNQELTRMREQISEEKLVVREALGEIKGDLRYVRQMLEKQNARP